MARARTVWGLIAAGGLVALAVAAPAQAATPYPTTLTEKAPTVVTYGATGAVTGRLVLQGTPFGLSGEAVTLLSKVAGATSWTTGPTHTTDVRGNVGFLVKPTRATQYLLRHAADRYTTTSSSAALTVKVAWRVTATLTSAKVAPKAHDTVSVSVAPKASGASVVLQTKGSSGWTTVKTATLSAGSTVTIGFTAPSAAGSYSYRVVKAAGGGYVTGVSATRVLKVA